MDTAISKCRAIQEVAARAACYDALVDAEKNPAKQAPDIQQLLHENQQQREELARLRKAPADTIHEAPKELIDRISTLETGPSGWIITLKNGQIWRQRFNKRYHLQNGQQVRIYPTIWGSDYRLSAEGNGSFIQVRRIR